MFMPRSGHVSSVLSAFVLCLVHLISSRGGFEFYCYSCCQSKANFKFPQSWMADTWMVSCEVAVPGVSSVFLLCTQLPPPWDSGGTRSLPRSCFQGRLLLFDDVSSEETQCRCVEFSLGFYILELLRVPIPPPGLGASISLMAAVYFLLFPVQLVTFAYFQHSTQEQIFHLDSSDS